MLVYHIGTPICLLHTGRISEVTKNAQTSNLEKWLLFKSPITTQFLDFFYRMVFELFFYSVLLRDSASQELTAASFVYHELRWSIMSWCLSPKFKYMILYIFTCILHHLRVFYELTVTTNSSPSWLDSSVGRALHWYRRGHCFESRSGIN